MLTAAMSTGHTIGLTVVALLFIGFALVSSFVVPRRWPDYPGKNAIGIFAVVCVLLFAAQLSSIWFFGAESEQAKGAEKISASQGASGAVRTVKVQENEDRIQLPALKPLQPGKVTFVVTNTGKSPHDFEIAGGKIAGPTKTATIAPGETAKLVVSLEHGIYTLYSAKAGHREPGLAAQLAVQ